MTLFDSKAPGVYVEEVQGGARPIQAVGTSTAGFVGAVRSPTVEVNTVRPVNNWMQFKRQYHLDLPSAKQAAEAAKQAADAARGGTNEKKELEAVAKAAEEYAKSLETESASTPLTNAVYGFFQNGGGRCYVVNIGNEANASVENGLAELDRVGEIAIVAAPGGTSLADYEAVIGHCERMMDRVAILDAPMLSGNQNIDMLTQVARVNRNGRAPASDYASYYFPHIRIRDPLRPEDKSLHDVAPSGHVAGIWARSDNARGVHKAPANEKVTGALDLAYHLTDEEQGSLNQAGVNCIRYFSDSGIIVWGARTVAKNPEWRYLNVRRLFNMVEKSIATSTRWIVFEPNDRPLWQAITRDVTAFLTRIWRTGALMGATPEEAFFVKCDAETNPQEEIDAGKVTILIGIAPVKPAEFVVFRISQYESGTDVEVQGA